MAKLKSLKKRERERETVVEVLTQQQAAGVAMGHCFNDAGAVMRHS